MSKGGAMNEEKDLYEIAEKNLELMKECKEILNDITKINKELDNKEED